MKERFVILIIVSLLFFQLVYGFFYPSNGFSDTWQPISTYLPKFSAKSSDNFLLSKVYPLISKDYRLNSDVGNYLELARNFGPQIFNGHIFTNRPLYPFLIFLTSLPARFFLSSSYGLVFASAILLNFILIVAAVWFFWRLLKEIFSVKVAWLSSVLLIFSPFVHSFLNQPLAEMLMVFGVVLSTYLLRNYVKDPSLPKLIGFSLIVGTLMLGKMFFAIAFFVILLALYFKRYKEGLIFAALQTVPLISWYLWVTKVWKIEYFVNEVQNWQMGTWIFSMVNWPWSKIYGVFLNFVPDFLTALIFSFLLLPILFLVAGFPALPLKSKVIFYFGPIFSVFLLGILIGFYYVRHVFLLFPIVYPMAALGMERIANYLGKRGQWSKLAFYVIVIGLIIAMSNVNIYQVFDYNE